jgi:hypothetical protein
VIGSVEKGLKFKTRQRKTRFIQYFHVETTATIRLVWVDTSVTEVGCVDVGW